MKIFVAQTDPTWYFNLAGHQPTPSEVNFWRPSASAFRALEPGCPLLFKLKRPYNRIAGVGFFHSYTVLPIGTAWATFEYRNGRQSVDELYAIIAGIRKTEAINNHSQIGCIMLENPVFFDEADWIAVPDTFASNIVQGKSFDTLDPIGGHLWSQVRKLLEGPSYRTRTPTAALQVTTPVYGREYLRKSRPGQASFRLALTEAYARRCAVTGENILPVLEAAHIQPVSKNGSNEVTNGLLLRSDMHTLFDEGLISVSPDLSILISNSIRDRYVNGKIYYAWQGKKLTTLPNHPDLYPNPDRLAWHNNNVFLP
jgi:putative restriction endonuclease